MTERKARQLTRPAWHTVLRTTLHTIVSFAAAAPLIYTAITCDRPEAAVGGAAVLLAVAGTLTRIVAVPAVREFLHAVAPWLMASPTRSEVPDLEETPGSADFDG